MCIGSIVSPAEDIKVGNAKKEFAGFFKIFLKKLFEDAVRRHPQRVNCCHICGDLEIEGWWQRLPHPQKGKIFSKIKEGSIIINGAFKVCDFCVSLEKEKAESKKNLYMDFEGRVYV